MAFSSIVWNGTGVIANCDGLSDSIGGTWAELGGGGISYNTDQYLTGAGSIGHVYASKSGFGYYTTNTTYDFSGGGTEEGQFIYIWINISSSSAFDTLANNGFSFVVGTDTSNYRTYKLAGSGAGENNGWSTGWKLFVFDPTITGSITDVGTFDLSTINMIGLWIDTIVSVRADTIFIDQVAIAKGLRVTDGTGTMSDIVTYCAKTLGTRAWGVFQYKGRFYYSAGGLTVGDSTSQTANTTLTSEGSIIGYEISEFYHDTNGWSLTHPTTYNKITLEKHTSYTTDYTSTNTSVYGHTDATLAITNDTGATYNVSGGTFEELAAITMNSDQDLDGAIFTECSTRNINGAVFNNNYVATSDAITATSVGSFSGNTLYHSTATSAVIALDLDDIDVCHFVSGGTGHAINLGTISANDSMGWSNTESGYAATNGSTGNETILVNVATGITLTINVATGASTPTIYNTGSGTVTVVSSFTLTLTNIPQGMQVTIVNSSTRAELQNSIAPVNGIVTYVHGGGETVDILFMDLDYDPLLSDIYDLTLPNSNSSIKLQMFDDDNFDNPAGGVESVIYTMGVFNTV